MQFTKPFFLLFFLGVLSLQIQAQKLLVLNGGLYGSTSSQANLAIFDPLTGISVTLDTIHTNSVQDILIEDNRYAYVAAQDSIVKYDLMTRQRVAAAAFGGVSTLSLALHGNHLLVGNWYGLSSGNLRIFDKTTLNFVSEIPEITQGAKDIVVIQNKAYIAQNSSTSMYQDTMGYLATVDLNTLSFLRYDTLASFGEDLGRLVVMNDSIIYAFNGVSNKISYCNVNNLADKGTYPSNTTLNPLSTGNTAYFDGSLWYISNNNGIGSYDVDNATEMTNNIVSIASSFSFAVDFSSARIYVSYIDYVNQSNNKGIYYNLTGDSLGVFPVGASPEVLEIWNDQLLVNTETIAAHTPIKVEAFPNPTNGFTTLRSEATPIQSFVILDAMGRLVDQQLNLNASQINFDLSSYSSGIYYVLVQTVDGLQNTTKILKK